MNRSRWFCVGVCAIASILFLCGSLQAQKATSGVVWNFDEPSGAAVHDSAGNVDDQIGGFWSRVPGVEGKALEFDGYTTRIVRPAKGVPALGDAFSLSAWVALNNYPWNWVPLVDQSEDNQVGYFFGIDAFGHVGFNVAANGVWQQLVSTQKLPLKKWIHLTATYDGKSGMTIYIDGEPVAKLQSAGPFAQAEDADLYVGRVRTPQLPFPAWLSNPQDPIKYSFDGYMDEVSILNRAITAQEEKKAVAEAKAPAGEVIPYAVLPSGAPGAGPFGAYYESLKFTPIWDRPRRLAPDSDVVVRFEHSPMRLVFWQGTNFIPAWVTGNGKWYTDEFLETWGPKCVDGGDCEPMSDKQSRYSHVRILESTPARAVIHWRYALAEARNYKGAFADPETGWFDWADEYWTVYPDGVAVRKQVIWSSDLDPKLPAGREWQESIVINGPGQRPDNIDPAAITLLNMAGESHTYVWKEKADDSFDFPKVQRILDQPQGANIQVVNLKSTEKPFEVVWPRGVHWDAYNDWKSYSMFEWWNHWPVAQPGSSGRPAVAPDRASHSSLSHIYWDAYQRTDQTETKLLLNGLTAQPAALLVPLAKSWISPPAITVASGDASGAEYDPAQRAFVVHRGANAKAGGVTLKLTASDVSPLVNPAFVIENWSGPTKVTVSGEGLKPGTPVRMGYVHHLEGDTLVLFVELNSSRETQIKVEAAAK
jgi:hypothetical protein